MNRPNAERPTILVVDDMPTNLSLLNGPPAAGRYRVKVANGGQKPSISANRLRPTSSCSTS